ncbi:ABC-F family ATP-binding cassette domain-containing protein [Arcanobacterium hippocoleae]|uniref:ATPase subunit of ABC transporter with duplicated ATPase domains n=1 Tax=Arcanobacterium hippocoleae TaxID=149017 RepID=A0ABU1SZT5_9ACTO|nr:ABC-F family ATP-binding cassette domain-containing protein [Arcanobacterium hippocoleae]MDR6938618.1 ATPase subunit of ABC transporter with duplicated ATPase domains [Arcanobacterium hippocoleae]
MINVSNLTMQIGTRVLIKDANLHVDKGQKIGLVGRNGAGKTTLLKLLSGQASNSDVVDYAGTISRRDEIGYLAQDPRIGDPQQLAKDRVLSVRGIAESLRRIRKAEWEMSNLSGPKQTKAIERYARLDAEFRAAGGWAAEAEAAKITAALGLPARVLEQELHTLSGGQRRRVELARVLFSEAKTLLLDEPTNHLDHDSILWLRDWIKAYSGGVILISHSVDLLDETVNQIWYLDANRAVIDQYAMGWSTYLLQRELDEKRRRKERQNAEKKAAQLLAQANKLRYKATKAVAAQNMEARANELLAGVSEERKDEKVAAFRFPQPAHCGKTPLQISGLVKNYGSLEIFAGLDLAVDRESRIVILGENGSGKTTLLRIIAGIEQADAGEIIPGNGLRLGYYAQEHETIDNTKTVYENMQSVADNLDETQMRSVLGSFLFSGADADKSANVLSGGEKTRLALAMLVVSQANVLMLDEPTNNLDPASRAEILKALGAYQGAVILVTHDEGAVRALDPDRVLILPDGAEDLWSEDYLELLSIA